MDMVHGCPNGLGTDVSGLRLPNGAILLKELFSKNLWNLNYVQMPKWPSKI